MFNLAIDSKLRACDLTKLRLRDTRLGSSVEEEMQRLVRFEITEQIGIAWKFGLRRQSFLPSDFLFKGRIHPSPHLSTLPIL
jgi:hypothetical protein